MDARVGKARWVPRNIGLYDSVRHFLLREVRPIRYLAELSRNVRMRIPV